MMGMGMEQMLQMFASMNGMNGPNVPAGYSPNIPKDIRWKETKTKDFSLAKEMGTDATMCEDIEQEYVQDTQELLLKIQNRPAGKKYSLLDNAFPSQVEIFKKLVDNTIVRVEFLSTEGSLTV